MQEGEQEETQGLVEQNEEVIYFGNLLFPKHHDIYISSSTEIILTLTHDGKIEVGANVAPDEAAQKFLEALAKLYPQWLRNPNVK